jgi:hypothetical protein
VEVSPPAAGWIQQATASNTEAGGVFGYRTSNNRNIRKQKEDFEGFSSNHLQQEWVVFGFNSTQANSTTVQEESRNTIDHRGTRH